MGYLYRFYDEDGALLYVGVTSSLGRRWSAHGSTKPWWPDVARATIDFYASAIPMFADERAAIENEHPKHNIQFAQASA